MQLLYKAFACEDLEGKRLLLPGYVVTPDSKRPEPGTKVKVELADGTFLETITLGVKPFFYSESLPGTLGARVDPTKIYCALEVSREFSAPGIELGANVYLV